MCQSNTIKYDVQKTMVTFLKIVSYQFYILFLVKIIHIDILEDGPFSRMSMSHMKNMTRQMDAWRDVCKWIPIWLNLLAQTPKKSSCMCIGTFNIHICAINILLNKYCVILYLQRSIVCPKITGYANFNVLFR